MRIIPADLDPDRYGSLLFIRGCLGAWRHYRATGQRSREDTCRATLDFAIWAERRRRVQRLKDILLRDIRDDSDERAAL